MIVAGVQLRTVLRMLDYEAFNTLPTICQFTLQANIKVNHFCEWKPVTPIKTHFTAK